MTREEAIKLVKRIKGAMVYTEEEKEALETLIPELRESEDEMIRKHIIDIVKDNAKSKSIPCDAEIAYLEKQKEQKPAEWSKEDKNALNYLHELIGFGFIEKFFDAQTATDMREWLNTRLKSLRPQPHTVSIKDATKFGNLEYERGVKDGIQGEKSRQWKPSEEQMDAFEDAMTYIPEFYKPKSNLASLLRDLKKLM